MKNGNGKHAKRRRIIALMTREEIEFLDKLGLDALFTTKHKLSRVSILGAMVDAAIKLGIDAKGIRSKKDLTDRILNAICGELGKNAGEYIKEENQ